MMGSFASLCVEEEGQRCPDTWAVSVFRAAPPGWRKSGRQAVRSLPVNYGASTSDDATDLVRLTRTDYKHSARVTEINLPFLVSRDEAPV